MSPKRAYWLAFVAFRLSTTIGVTLDLAMGVVNIDTVAAAAGAVTVIYRVVIALRDPDRTRPPSDWGPLEHGAVTAGLYTVDIAFQLYAVVT